MKLFPIRSQHLFLSTLVFLPTALFLAVFWASGGDQPPTPVLAQIAAPQVLGENSPAEVKVNPALTAQAPQLIKPLDLEPVAAKSFLVYDVASQTALARRNENYPMPVASLTKLLTAYVAYNQLDLAQEVVTVPPTAIVDVSPILSLQPEDEIQALDLFKSMLVGSANDAAEVLANFVAERSGLSFKDLMNKTAAELGMANSRFSNPLGFDSETNYSTATDLQLLVNATKQWPAFGLLGRQASYSFKSEIGNNYSIRTTNKLLASDPEISSIKTGFTDEAQGAMITEINHDNNKFIIIVLGSPNREGDTLQLKRAIINSYQW